ncbi:hypothetical protein NXV73_23115 [Bacteroides salyersiae]|nr:hypothetical protein [Bacteroides salyersiae]MCS3284644.1 hypothetical protein [Bacteroides salyersiae]
MKKEEKERNYGDFSVIPFVNVHGGNNVPIGQYANVPMKEGMMC